METGLSDIPSIVFLSLESAKESRGSFPLGIWGWKQPQAWKLAKNETSQKKVANVLFTGFEGNGSKPNSPREINVPKVKRRGAQCGHGYSEG